MYAMLYCLFNIKGITQDRQKRSWGCSVLSQDGCFYQVDVAQRRGHTKNKHSPIQTHNTYTHMHEYTKPFQLSQVEGQQKTERQFITPGKTELSYLSFITFVFSPFHLLLPFLPSAVKANAASVHSVSSSASSFNGQETKRKWRQNH